MKIEHKLLWLNLAWKGVTVFKQDTAIHLHETRLDQKIEYDSH